ncbi:hypothetical protein BAUCODRAFT_66397 [Baudoinia panamericana UAMH 10762]|uniref:Uncharacterized protein n=1 Tax=Baudoinia panamericana (strain UAMH 10762) TaxID=717646 RepID=M2NEY5_BAUPA|nr:uncharacterized protein BAUCODRAFT_66397 [Baudoinia panamericana UAMH 10762]EMC97824.1 hypothetical protein BAUCODRAFT_66397 [Baudoinia panamericana UAMH 10762]
MSHPQPPQRQPTPSETESYLRAVHYVALTALVACPALALIPPRKFDLYTLGLVGTTAISANYLTREQTGRSIWQHVSGQRKPVLGSLPPTEQANLNRELHHAQAWKAQREKEIQDDLDVGKGFGEMITDQIWEVWNGGKKTSEDGTDDER